MICSDIENFHSYMIFWHLSSYSVYHTNYLGDLSINGVIFGFLYTETKIYLWYSFNCVYVNQFIKITKKTLDKDRVCIQRLIYKQFCTLK